MSNKRHVSEKFIIPKAVEIRMFLLIENGISICLNY